MTRALAHRGPDGHGTFVNGPVGLGNRRLAIIDLTEAGRQPLSNETESIWLTFNGEIYNHRELRRELRSRGHSFRSRTDSEVIVHAYEEWGQACLERFNGMFAFAIWDSERRSLWLARDRLGIKPLFYAHQRDRLSFGSEISALLQDPTLGRELDTDALSLFLSTNYVLAPQTMLSEIKQLEPGTHLTVGPESEPRIVRYWSPPVGKNEPRHESDAIAAFDEIVSDSVRARLLSDVPVGAFLSGGLDSSALAYWMAQHHAGLDTFSIGFQEKEYDEGHYAENVARRIGSRHHSRVLTADDALAIVPEVVRFAQEPSANSSMVAYYRLAELARTRVTVALSGDGADELLAGYDTYLAYYCHRFVRRLPERLRRDVLLPWLRRRVTSEEKVGLAERAVRLLSAESPPPGSHAEWRRVFSEAEKRSLLDPIWPEVETAPRLVDRYLDVFQQVPDAHPLDRLMYADLRLYLPNDGLVKVDRMSMAHGLEARVPFLDHHVVEFLLRLPVSLKLRHGFQRKYILRRAMRGKLPPATLKRPKAGFNMPKGKWLRTAMRDLLCDALAEDELRRIGIFDVRYVQALVKEHLEGARDRSHQLWGLLMFSLWWHEIRPASRGAYPAGRS